MLILTPNLLFLWIDNYQVWQDNSTINLVPNSFNFINANNTTLVFPSKPENVVFLEM
jgi:hypothetical protein